MWRLFHRRKKLWLLFPFTYCVVISLQIFQDGIRKFGLNSLHQSNKRLGYVNLNELDYYNAISVNVDDSDNLKNNGLVSEKIFWAPIVMETIPKGEAKIIIRYLFCSDRCHDGIISKFTVRTWQKQNSKGG